MPFDPNCLFGRQRSSTNAGDFSNIYLHATFSDAADRSIGAYSKIIYTRSSELASFLDVNPSNNSQPISFVYSFAQPNTVAGSKCQDRRCDPVV